MTFYILNLSLRISSILIKIKYFYGEFMRTMRGKTNRYFQLLVK